MQRSRENSTESSRKMPLLSVIVPTYQRAAKIALCLESYFDVLKQASECIHRDFEFIVVDDGSNDGSHELLQHMSTRHSGFHVVRLDNNSGPGLARNAGLEHAIGTWIWFLDDDDSLDASSTRGLLKFLVEDADGFDLVAHSLRKKYSIESPHLARELGSAIIFYREYQEVFRYIVRRELVTGNELRFSVGLHEDIAFVTALVFRSTHIKIFDHQVVEKKFSDDAITAKMSEMRIDGYLKAYEDVKSFLVSSGLLGTREHRGFLVQTLGVILLLITREVDPSHACDLIEHLDRSLSKKNSQIAFDLRSLPCFGPESTNFEYAVSLLSRRGEASTFEVLTTIREVFNTRLSCKDLDSSLFLGPDEIRACCKRFFVNGFRKGDVVLLKARPNIELSDITRAKEDLITRLNEGAAPECSGCPYIERRRPGNFKVDYLSLENFAYCNMRCSYCSPKYYGGTEARYNAAALVSELARIDGFSRDCHVVWGGGEPTLSPRFSPINASLSEMPTSAKIRVLSNSLKFSAELGRRLRDKRFQLVTSIDAGLEETFLKIRGRPGLAEVFENLRRYREIVCDPRRITVKYIICAENLASEELSGFVSNLVKYALVDSLFQISCDFNLECPEERVVSAIYELAVRLYEAGVSHVFFDDLIRDRVRLTPQHEIAVREHLLRCGLSQSYVFASTDIDFLVLWGIGKQSSWIMDHTNLGRSKRILAVVKSASDYHLSAKQMIEYGLVEERLKILPAGVQSMYEILLNIEQSGLESRLLRAVPI